MRVLLAEDYPPLNKSLTKGLKEAGFAVDTVMDGERALWHARNGQYDTIILDIMLPKMDGLSVLRQIRRDGNAQHVLILTAKDQVADRVAGLDAGADDYLVKPFAFEELLARVRALVRREYNRKAPALEIGDLSIDTTAKLVALKGKRVQLSAREYALLEYLAMRAGEVVSRDEIWQHLYDFNASVTSNVVDVYVGFLRKKLDHDGKSLIRTIRGQGYVLGEQPCSEASE